MKLPAHLHTTQREWKSRKRREWKSVLVALRRYRFGCAFTPDQDSTLRLFEMAEAITKSLTTKEWGR